MNHFYERVPGWAAFRALYAQVVADAPRHRPSQFVEIGSWLGKSAAFMAVEIINSGKDIKFACVDPWSDGGPDLAHRVKEMSVPIYEQFRHNIAPVRNHIRAMRMPSLEAVKYFANESVDFVMIDGSHKYEDILADIHAWRPKIVHGGILSGDDHNFVGVRRAVAECFDMDRVKVVERIRDPNPRDLPHPAYWSIRL